MISYDEALHIVLDQAQNYGAEEVALSESLGRILAETIVSDRDFPPFNRATKDGIAIRFDDYESPQTQFKTMGTAQAGSPQLILDQGAVCIEIMTGAIIPKDSDTVIMYEHLHKTDGGFTVQKHIQKGQNIHYQASDVSKNEPLLYPGTLLDPAEIGILASVGKSRVFVQKLPKVAVVATGNELVEVDDTPAPFQIRKSNSHTLVTLLKTIGIAAESFHFMDESSTLKKNLDNLLGQYDTLILSGGVSKGKYDFLPGTFSALGVEKLFHGVLQRPGKPFWFGKHSDSQTLIFSFPGNPVSTFVNYHLYFVPWLNKTLGRKTERFTVLLEEPIENTTDLTLFKGVTVKERNGTLYAASLSTTGSGDLLGLSKADGFIQLNPKDTLKAGEVVPILVTRRII
ncbi:molybdopterin molybdotransferase MoeA [Flagellimonas meishanensis]|uniref:molybdopterin molybdotransferase MoeA n=1 Tax=Flagellimonas meishanensis TaxID=2873264 RepID=UPI001CA63DF4|nr:molybdopterin molybdotransferase MoeA [[Muricauda] meishanensis]